MDSYEAPVSGRTGLPAPSPATWLHWRWSQLTGPLVTFGRWLSTRWLLARGVRRPRRWWRPWIWLEVTVVAAASLGLLIPSVIDEDLPSVVRGVLAGIGATGVATLGAVWFLAWRLPRARRYYLRKAKRDAVRLVRSGSIIGAVVGRDQLCGALMNDLRDRHRRRPHVIVGAIGAGKTAVLVRLTELLARNSAVPVVLQLQDLDLKAKGELDFTELARERFLAEVRESVYPGEAEKAWQRLRYRSDSIVVLADGLEDALTGVPDRANRIRKAIADADDERLPLVLTSRPQESLQAMRAANTVLEPLGEEPALRYVSENSGWRSDKRRLDWVIEAANVAESPLYLNVAKDLEARYRLEPIAGGGVGDALEDPRDQDEWVLRYDLLEAWTRALIDGALYPEQSLSHDGRFMTVEYLSALACVATVGNSSLAAYELLEEPEDKKQQESGKPREDTVLRKLLLSGLEERKKNIGGESAIDVRLAGSWGSRLGLVEEQGNGVRFRHSVLQAYLASRYFERIVQCALGNRRLRPEIKDDGAIVKEYFTAGLKHPNRELSMALVFYSRSREALKGCRHKDKGMSLPVGTKVCPVGYVRNQLRTVASETIGESSGSPRKSADDIEEDPRIWALEMYMSALDIDSFHHKPDHRNIVEEIRDSWDCLQEYNQRKLDPTKKELIGRIGATARLISGRNEFSSEHRMGDYDRTAYDHMFAMACVERSYAVRFTFAQEIGEGGDRAFFDIWPSQRTEPQVAKSKIDRRIEFQFTRASGTNAGVFGLSWFDPRLRSMGSIGSMGEPATGLGEADFLVDKNIIEFIYEASAGLRGNRTAPRVLTRARKTLRPWKTGSGDKCSASIPGTTRTERTLRKDRQQQLLDKQQDQENSTFAVLRFAGRRVYLPTGGPA